MDSAQGTGGADDADGGDGAEGRPSTGTGLINPAKGDFSHPVFKKLAQINSEINKMTKEDIQRMLKDLHLDARGTKDVMKKRLKSYFKKRKLAQNNIKTPQETTAFRHLLVIDFEATCEANAPQTYCHEIIEFPIVVVNCETQSVECTYQRYVKPVMHRRLTAFCTELTGITQAMVDGASTFAEVLSDVERWLEERELIGEAARGKVAVVTDGPWDVLRFLFGQCKLSRLLVPKWAREWINVRKLYASYYGSRPSGGLQGMLASLGMAFEGRPHCGLDDARNVARIALRLLADGCTLRINERLYDWRCRRHAAALARDLQGRGDTGVTAAGVEDDGDDARDGEKLWPISDEQDDFDPSLEPEHSCANEQHGLDEPVAWLPDRDAAAGATAAADSTELLSARLSSVLSLRPSS